MHGSFLLTTMTLPCLHSIHLTYLLHLGCRGRAVCARNYVIIFLTWLIILPIVIQPVRSVPCMEHSVVLRELEMHRR